MRGLGIGLGIVGALAATSAQAATPTTSWGKPGTSREVFEGGARDCMVKAARRDVAGDNQTRAYRRGFEVLERENNMPPMPTPDDPTFVRSERQVLLRRMYRQDQQVDSLQARLQSEVDACLVQAGYVRFALTREQERQVRRLRPGSEPRKRYLYTLGSDRRIVEAQKIAD